MIKKIPRTIIEKAKNNDIVFFLGAGLSRTYGDQRGFPTGIELAQMIAYRLLDRNIESNESLMMVAQEAVWGSSGSRHGIESILTEIFENPGVRPLPAHLALAQLDSNMVTTNYDTLIEQAFKKSGKRLCIAYRDDHLSRLSGTLLLKAHGCITEPQSCVITEDDYYEWFEKEPDLRAILRSFFVTKTICFVGYSVTDPNFRGLVRALRFKFGALHGQGVIVLHKIKPSYDYDYLVKSLGLIPIEMDATDFLNGLVKVIGKDSFVDVLDSDDIRRAYFNTSSEEPYSIFAARYIIERLSQNKAGHIQMSHKFHSIFRAVLKKTMEFPGSIFVNRWNEQLAHISQIEKQEGLIYVPEGEFIAGGERLGNEQIRIERLERPVLIGKHLVTNREYREFLEWVRKNEHNPHRHPTQPEYKSHDPDYDIVWENFPSDYHKNPKYDDYPVGCIDWWDAYAYCSWRGGRLPTEKEWEKAARGIDGRRFPWGDEFDPEYANTLESGRGLPNSVGEFEKGRSPFGCYDMAGNVWEWCADKVKTGKHDSEISRVVRGGSFSRDEQRARCAFRNGHTPESRWPSRGFRLAKDI